MNLAKWFTEKVLKTIIHLIPAGKKRIEFREKMADIYFQLNDKYYDVIVKLQGQSSGTKFVDGFKHMVRPIIALVMMYEQVAWNHGWSVNEPNQWITNGIIGFYFASRGLEKTLGKS